MNFGQKMAPQYALAELHTAACWSGRASWKDNSHQNSLKIWAKWQGSQKRPLLEKKACEGSNRNAHERNLNHVAKDHLDWMKPNLESLFLLKQESAMSEGDHAQLIIHPYCEAVSTMNSGTSRGRFWSFLIFISTQLEFRHWQIIFR